MSDVTLRVGGRAYKLACKDGEEAQLAKLGAMVDAKIKAIEPPPIQQEAQNLLFAAILLADELSDARAAIGDDPAEVQARLSTLEAENRKIEKARNEAALELDAVRAERDALANDIANMKSAAQGQEPLFSGIDPAPKLEELAMMLENCADALESKLAAS